MSEPKDWHSPANSFLQKEVYRLGSEPGLRSLPPGTDRDFLTLTWGLVVYRTTYAPDSQRLLKVFLRRLNDEVRKSLPKILPGSPEQMRLLERTYSSKVFSSEDMYDGVDEATIQQAFHDWKISLALPAIEVPVRLRVCLVVDDNSLANLTASLTSSTLENQDTDAAMCPVKVVEDNFPDLQRGDNCSRPDNQGWTTVTLSSLLEVYQGLHQGKCLADYHKPGSVYLGDNRWS